MTIKEILALNSFAKQNKTTSIILMLKLSVILNNSRKRLNRISLTKDQIPIDRISLSEKGRLMKDPVAIATTMNHFFVNIT